MTAFVIAHVDVQNPEGYKEYTRPNTAMVEKYGGRFVARGGRVELLEGQMEGNRLVIMEFPSVEAAQAWYNAPEYQEIAPLRRKNSHMHLLAIVEGA